MSEEYLFDLNDVNVSNIATISGKQSRLEEQRILEIYELVSEVIVAALELRHFGMGICEILTLLSESLELPENCIHKNALSLNLPRLERFSSSLSALDKTVFAELFVEEMSRNSVEITAADFLPVNDSPDTFVYVKNSLADEAYDVFADAFTDPRVRYAPSFREAVRAVTDGEVTYCLLPLEEMGGERLHSASALIFRNDLKINSVTPVFGFDGTADMKYSLVSKRFTIPKIEKDDDVYLEIRIPTEGGLSLSELLYAAEYYGFLPYRVNTAVFDTAGDREAYYSLVFKSSMGDFSELLVYLTLFAGSYIPVGIYKNLE